MTIDSTAQCTLWLGMSCNCATPTQSRLLQERIASLKLRAEMLGFKISSMLYEENRDRLRVESGFLNFGSTLIVPTLSDICPKPSDFANVVLPLIGRGVQIFDCNAGSFINDALQPIRLLAQAWSAIESEAEKARKAAQSAYRDSEERLQRGIQEGVTAFIDSNIAAHLKAAFRAVAERQPTNPAEQGQ